MSSIPLVSVICLCYNQKDFVTESINSILKQSYQQIEIIIIDDASTDNSAEIIRKFLIDQPEITFIPLKKNLGNCAAFNKGLDLAKGKYVIDLAADDLLIPDRIENQVNIFENLSEDYAVVFSDAILIDKSGNKLKTFYKRDEKGKLIQHVPSGDIYKELIKKMIICSPTMMMRKKVLDELGGYDATLSYEDYDFWVRSGRKYKYYYINEILTKKRVLSGSQRTKFYSIKLNLHLISTLQICKKAKNLNVNSEEDDALSVSVSYHLKLAFLTENFEICASFYHFLNSFHKPDWKDILFYRLSLARVRVNLIYCWYLKNVRKLKI